MLKLFLSFLLYIISFSTLASNWEPTPNDALKMQFFISQPAYNFEVSPPKTSSLSALKYEPSVAGKLGISLGYRNLAASLSTGGSVENNVAIKQGRSSSTDFQFRFYGKRTYEFSYQTYDSYFLKDTNRIDSSYINGNELIRPDITSRNFTFNFFWNYNEDDFSLRVALDQDGIQNQSGWANFAVLSYTDGRISGSTPFVPTIVASQFGSISQVKGLNRRSLSAGYGIGGTYCKNNFYISGFFALALSTQLLDVDFYQSSGASVSAGGGYASIRTSMGYNSEKHITGMQVIGDMTSSPVSNGQISGATYEVKLFYAYRFSGIDIPFLNPISAWFD